MPGFTNRFIVEHQVALALMGTDLLTTGAQFCRGQVCLVGVNPSVRSTTSLERRQLTVRWRKYDTIYTYINAYNSHTNEVIRKGSSVEKEYWELFCRLDKLLPSRRAPSALEVANGDILLIIVLF